VVAFLRRVGTDLQQLRGAQAEGVLGIAAIADTALLADEMHCKYYKKIMAYRQGKQ